MNKILALASAATIASVLSSNGAITFLGGDFEGSTGTFPTGWSGTATPNSTTPLEGSVSASAANINQDFSDANDVFNFQLDFLVSLGSVTAQNQRVRLRGDGNSGDLITLRFNENGIDRFSGSWAQVTASPLAVDTPYFIRILGSDLDAASRSYSVEISTDGVNYTTGTSTNFHSAAVGTGFETLVLESAAGGATWDSVSVVAIPEPSQTFLGLLGGIVLLRRRR